MSEACAVAPIPARVMAGLVAGMTEQDLRFG